ncbi:MAG: DUF294 nucleotidyltransferase-like domain-containing protein [Chloroflexota bacterium]
MDDIARFLYEHPPFSLLSFDEIRQIAGMIAIEYFPAEQMVLMQDGTPSDYLYIVRRGSADLLRTDEQGVQVLMDTLDEGEAFGYVSLIRGSSPVVSVRTNEETLAYLLPKAVFHQLRQRHHAFAQFFAESVGARLDNALQIRHASADPELFQTRLGDLKNRSLVSIQPEAPVRKAAQTMREYRVSSLIVTTTPPGIVTDRDLRNRVLADGLPDTTPINQIMSAPAITMPGDSLVFEGLMLMIERGIHHIALTEGEQIIGVVTNTDILRRQTRNLLFLSRQLKRAQSLEELQTYTDQIAAMVGALLVAGARFSDIGRMVAVSHDALLIRLIRDAEEELGPPPCPYAWLVCGSEGRYEQTMRTDQDNALIYSNDANAAEVDGYFAKLAERVVDQLVACGFPRCPGDIMATNRQWRQPMQVWQQYFQRWIHVPKEEALLRVAIFFDYRQVYGSLMVQDALRPMIEQAREQRVFLAQLARATLRHSPEIHLFQRLFRQRRGHDPQLLDLKMRGTAPIVNLARLFALESGCTHTNTIARLRQAGGNSSLSRADAEELIAAFELLSLLRLRHQYAQLQHEQPMTNHISMAQLSPLERRELKEALHVVQRLQENIELAFQTPMLG